MVNDNDDNNNINDNIPNYLDLKDKRIKIYFSRRKELKYLMKNINSRLDNSSQTFFLTLYYMDLIFTNNNLEKIFYSHFYEWNNYAIYNDIQKNNYVLLSLACLIIASKYNENDPHVPSLSSYINLLYEYSQRKYIFNLPSIYLAEVVVLKILKYKLNYYSVYHYLLFFFTHGIIFKDTIKNSKYFQKASERKILEKIYIKSREIIDWIIDDEKFFNYYLGKDNYIFVVVLFLWSIEFILDININDKENIFKLCYNINISESKKRKIYDIINNWNNAHKKKNNMASSIKTKSINNKNSNEENKNLISQQSTRNNNPKYLINYSKTLSSIKQGKVQQSQNLNNEDNFFKFYNGLIQDELEKFNSNYPTNNKFGYPTSSKFKIYLKEANKNYKSNISYGPNKRVYLNSNKNLDNYELNNQKNNNNTQKNICINSNNINSSKNLAPMRLDFKKEPIDNKKKDNINNYTSNNIQNKEIVNYTSSKEIKIVSSKKRSLIDIEPSFTFNFEPRPSTNIISKTKNKELFGDEPKDFILFSNQHFPKNDNNLIKPEKTNLFNNYKEYAIKKSQNNRKNNTDLKYGGKSSDLTSAIFSKYTKNSNSVEHEPKDNIKREINKKYYIENGKGYIVDNKYNNPRTIIINNNININNYIDKNSIKQKDFSKSNKQLFLFHKNNMNILFDNSSNNDSIQKSISNFSSQKKIKQNKDNIISNKAFDSQNKFC